MWLKGFDGRRIDTMFIDGRKSVLQNNEVSGEGIVIFCNPNAGYYEFSHEFQSQWLEFYTERGLSVMLWNYRGYGRSEGKPDSINIFKDGETIMKYLKRERRIKKIILHGESLGGTIAVNLAKKYNCDFLFADRTFGSLDGMAISLSGECAKWALKFITGWTIECTKDYMEAGCYKVVGNDPCDATINELASLKTSISALILIPNKNNFTKASHILSSREIQSLYKSLYFLYQISWIKIKKSKDFELM